jgi:hypothetical protein
MLLGESGVLKWRGAKCWLREVRKKYYGGCSWCGRRWKVEFGRWENSSGDKMDSF